MSDPRRTFSRVAVALDAVKLRDAQALAEIETQIAEVDAACALIDAQIRDEGGALAPDDIDAAVVYYEWRRRQERRRDALVDRRRALEEEAEKRRDVLRQSNGETHAVDHLIRKAAADATEQQRKKAIRRHNGS